MLGLLNAGPAIAGDYTATNQMPELIHNLLDAEGDRINESCSGIRPQYTNSLRNLKPVKYPPFSPLELPTPKAGWSLWKNSSIKRLDRNAGAIKESNPISLSQYEININYSFHF